MTQGVTFDLFFVSLMVLLLVLLVLLFHCWILRRSLSRNLTELRVSTGRPARTLTIRTESDHARQLLDHLLDRVILQVEPGSESGSEPGQELGEDRGPGVSTAASLPHRTVNTLQNKLWKWIHVAMPPPATPPPSPSNSPPTDQDQKNDICPQSSDVSQHASLSSQGPSCSTWWQEEEKHNESQP